MRSMAFDPGLRMEKTDLDYKPQTCDVAPLNAMTKSLFNHLRKGFVSCFPSNSISGENR